MRMNDLKLKQKIGLIMLICVMVPLITTNGFIFWNLKRHSDSEQLKTMENSMNAIVYEFQNAVAEQVSIADYLSRDDRLYTFLQTVYLRAADYYQAYMRLQQDDVIQYYYTGQSAYGITICTANQTITNGSYFVCEDQVQQAEWYRAFRDSGQQVLLYSFYEDGEKSHGYIRQGRHIAWMRKFERSGDDFIMMDLNYEKLLKKMWMECDDADCYICVDDQILLSTTEKNPQKKPLVRWSEKYRKQCFRQTDVELYGKKFTLILTEDRVGIWELISQQKNVLILLYVLNLLLPCIIVYLLYHSLHDRVAQTQACMDRVKEGTYELIDCEEGKDEIGSMIRSYNLMILRIRELIEVVYKNKEKQQNLELSKKQAELNALQSQLNPHFIFNALESIRMHSILKQEMETAKILENFAVLMRKNIQWSQDFVTVDEECENVRRYLEIQKYRFGDRLEFSLCIQESSRKYYIPRFVLITFVENACVHGIEQSINGGQITVVTSEDGEDLYFEVLDSGCGMDQTQLEKLQNLIWHPDMAYVQKARKSIGIANTVVRLHQYYQDKVQIEISSEEGEGTEICIRIPRRGNDSDTDPAHKTGEAGA